MNLYLSTHLFKGVVAFASSLWTMEVALLMAKAAVGGNEGTIGFSSLYKKPVWAGNRMQVC